jgi:hypothetical protein
MSSCDTKSSGQGGWIKPFGCTYKRLQKYDPGLKLANPEVRMSHMQRSATVPNKRIVDVMLRFKIPSSVK